MTSGLHFDIPNDIPLILKANCEERIKRIRFGPDVNQLCFDEFQRKVGNALQFDDHIDFSVTWQDDDGEYCHITNTDDLREALLYFIPSTSSSSNSNGGSVNGNEERVPITMRVNVQVETGLSLSDYGSSVWGGSDEEEEEAEWYGGAGGSPGSRRSMSSAASSHSRIRLSSASVSSGERQRRQKQGSSRISSQASTSSSNGAWQIARKEASPMLYSPNRFDLGRHGPSPLGKWRNGVLQEAGNGSNKSELSSLNSLSIHPSQINHDSDSSGTESDGTCSIRAPSAKHLGLVKHSSTKQSQKEEPDGYNIHIGIRCKTCNIEPIIGVRYHCASCVRGADFCADCERTGNAVRLSSHHVDSHTMIKFGTPMVGADVAGMLSRLLQTTSIRLYEEAAGSGSGSNTTLASSPGTRANTFSNTNINALSHQLENSLSKFLRCSFCVSPIRGTRYICANCPIISPVSRDGYNLCSACELQSLKCHDPSHFFIRVNYVPATNNDNAERIALGDRWEVQELTNGGALLPTLYSELLPPNPFIPPSQFIARPNGTIRVGDGLPLQGTVGSRIHSGSVANSISESVTIPSSVSSLGIRGWRTPWPGRQTEDTIELGGIREAESRTIVPLDQLVHPSILCDNCFQLIHGAWFRCCHCTCSYDLCGTCMSRIAHDHTHAFAVFKQPVDLDLFKSCVDHQDAGDMQGASRPMLSFELS